jgi:hypothetical protein
MCRNIKSLRNSIAPPTDEEIALAALQYVRKVSGYHSPSRANQEIFDAAVAEIADSTRKLMSGLTGPSSSRGQ